MMPTDEEFNECGDNAKFVEKIGALYLSDNFSDVTFIVEAEKLPAHKCVLAACSSYFRALLFGGLSESSLTEIELNVSLNAFKIVLKYIYTVHIPLRRMELQTICDSLSLAHEYGIEEMEAMITTHLINTVSLENCTTTFIATSSYASDKLKNAIMTAIDKIATEFLFTNEFKTLPQSLLCSLIGRDSFYATEADIFQAVLEWCKYNQKNGDDIQAVMSNVRFPNMELEDLLTTVRESSVIDPEWLLDCIYEKVNSKRLRCRSILTSEVNVASNDFNAKVINGIDPLELLNGNVANYDSKSGYTAHNIPDDKGIIVELENFYIINHIKILLWDGDNRSYSYYVEISQNQIDWDRVVDYTNHICRSWQNLYFTHRPVRYIKLVGTHNSANARFHAVALEAYNKLKLPLLINGIVTPSWNVASVTESARVSKGVAKDGDSIDVMLNGVFENYSLHRGYTCGQDDSITVQLCQPYNINSLRLLLWDLEVGRKYGFYIETSMNERDWQMAVNMRNERLRSWQKFTFETRPAVFIRIVGTYNSVGNGLHLVHFEAPYNETV